MRSKKGGSPPPRFTKGALVRVPYGIRDPDFPDIPMGGWAGTIREVDPDNGEATYLIAWNQATIENMHPIYKKRCNRDDLDMKSMWLGDDDLEPDDGNPVPVEQPAAIVTRPLSPKDPNDRVRMVFGLTSDDPLPLVRQKSLRTYYRYLAENLKFPFRAYHEDLGFSLSVVRLLAPKEYDLDVEVGLLCEARTREGPFDAPLSELDDAVGNRKLVRDYNHWFWGWE